MNPRTAVLATLAAGALRKLGQLAMRFLRSEPATDHERRIFLHLNGLIESVVNQVLNRTFAPHPLTVVK